jgi:hypothetical protein
MSGAGQVERLSENLKRLLRMGDKAMVHRETSKRFGQTADILLVNGADEGRQRPFRIGTLRLCAACVSASYKSRKTNRHCKSHAAKIE